MNATPTSIGPETIPGDPTCTTSKQADDQLDALAELGIQPYLVAVKLKDQPNALHVRVYVDNPPPNYAFASTEQLPTQVQGLVEIATATRNFRWLAVDSHAAVMTPAIASLVERLEENPRYY